MNRRFVPALCLLSLVLAGSAAAKSPAGFERNLSAARRQKDDGKYSEAFTLLQKAMSADPKRYETYFELAIVSYRMGNLSAAEEYARLALERAPQEERASIQEMLGVIAEKRDFERLEREGDEAYAKGLMAKAAESYRKAYRLFPKQGRVGLRAAAIHAEMPGRLLDAAALWNEVAEKGDADSAAAAQQELARFADELARLFSERMARLPEWKRTGNTAELIRLSEAFPRRPEPQLELAAIHAEKRDVRATLQHLGQAVRLGVKGPTVQGRQEFLSLLKPSSAAPEFARFIEDVFGSETLSSMRGGAQALERERERVQELKRFAGQWEPAPSHKQHGQPGKDIHVSVSDTGEVTVRFDWDRGGATGRRKCRVDDDMIKCLETASDSGGSYDVRNHFFLSSRDPSVLYRNLSVAPPTWGRSEYRRVK